MLKTQRAVDRREKELRRRAFALRFRLAVRRQKRGFGHAILL
jgi:hypothetical protein